MKQIIRIFLFLFSISLTAQSNQDSLNRHFSIGFEAGLGQFNDVYVNTTPFWFNSFKGDNSHESGLQNSFQLHFSYCLKKGAISLQYGLMKGNIDYSFSQDYMMLLDTATNQYEQTYVGMNVNGTFSYYYVSGKLQFDYLLFIKNRFQLFGFIGIGARTLYKLTEKDQVTFHSVFSNEEVYNEFTEFSSDKKFLLFSDLGIKAEYMISDSWRICLGAYYNTSLYSDVKDSQYRYNRFYSFGSKLGFAYYW